jgi:hypothetical protein
MNPPPEQRKPVTLEMLLSLKRAERPDPAFWPAFEAELKRRQLAAAIVTPRPWYRRVVHGWRPAVVGFASAAAVFAATFLLPLQQLTQSPANVEPELAIAPAVEPEEAAAAQAIEPEPEIFAEASFVVDVLTKPVLDAAPRRFSTLANVDTLRFESSESAHFADYTMTRTSANTRF